MSASLALTLPLSYAYRIPAIQDPSAAQIAYVRGLNGRFSRYQAGHPHLAGVRFQAEDTRSDRFLVRGAGQTGELHDEVKSWLVEVDAAKGAIFTPSP